VNPRSGILITDPAFLLILSSHAVGGIKWSFTQHLRREYFTTSGILFQLQFGPIAVRFLECVDNKTFIKTSKMARSLPVFQPDIRARPDAGQEGKDAGRESG
jgi:hypothetical protein